MDNLYKKVRGIFKPKNINTLEPQALSHIGKEFTFRYSWKINLDESELYAGQWAMVIGDPTPNVPCAWVPEEDVEILEELG